MLTIKTTECGAVNSYYQRENFKPTVTVCYELLKNIMTSIDVPSASLREIAELSHAWPFEEALPSVRPQA